MSRFQNHYTPDEDVVIIDGIAAGLTWEQIVASLPGRTPKTVRMRAARMGAHKPSPSNDVMECPKKPTRDLLLALEAQFAKASRSMGVDYLDARSLLMDGRFAA